MVLRIVVQFPLQCRLGCGVDGKRDYGAQFCRIQGKGFIGAGNADPADQEWAGTPAQDLRGHKARRQRYGIRAEAAYTWTEQPAGRDFEVKRPFLYLVVGTERKVWDDFNVNVQIFLRSVSSYRNPYAIVDPSLRSVAVLQAVLNHQLTRTENGMTFLVGRKWLNETLAGEIAAIYSFTQRDFLLRPRMSYAFSDHWRGSLGVDVYRGGENTFFGRLKANSAVFAELAYGF